MVNITVDESLHLTTTNKLIINKIKDDLTVDNPDYIKRLRLKKWIGNIPKTLNLYELNENTYILPFGYLERLEAFLKESDIKYSIINKNVDMPLKMIKKANLNLFDYQQEATRDVLKATNGILISPAGSGKTRMAMEIIGKRNQKTLWLTNNLTLLTQSKRVFKQFFSNKVGEISGGKINIQDVTFATVQTLSNVDLTKYKNTWGMVVVDECFSGDVEILTEKGFIRFDELGDEKVAQYHENGNIDFVVPSRKIKNRHQGNLIELHLHRDANVLMTPNHNHIYKNNKNKIVRKEVKDINFMRKIVSGKGIGNGGLTAFEQLLILTQADAHKTRSSTNQYQIQLQKKRKLDRFLDIVSRLDIDIKLQEVKTTRKGARRWTYYLPQEYKPKLFTDVFKVKDFGYQKAREFIDEVCVWDGYQRNGKNINYDSIIKENVDFVSAIATLGGYANYQVVRPDNRKETFSDIHRVFFQDIETQSKHEQKVYKKEVYYDDYVYCVEVPTHNIVVRSKGKTFISGNCHRIVGGPTKVMQFYKVLSNLNAKYKYGLTATLFEKPKDISMSPIFLLGEKLHKVSSESIERVTAEHILYKLYTETSDEYLNPDKTIDYNKLLDYLMNDYERNVNILTNFLENKNRHNLVLSSRNEHLETLSEMLNRFGIVNHVLIGLTPTKEREEMLQDFKEGKVNFILSNYQLAKEGLDLPIADTLHMVLPMREKKTIIQSAGRVERVYEGKTNSKVYDYVDINHFMLVNMYNDRRRHLNAR